MVHSSASLLMLSNPEIILVCVSYVVILKGKFTEQPSS